MGTSQLTAVVRLDETTKYVVARGSEDDLDALIAKLSLSLEEEYQAAEGYIEDPKGNIIHTSRKSPVT